MQMLYKAEERGHANHGWLDSYHSFSFAGYYDPNKMNFGSLRVLNDDTIAPGTGFDTHPHDNMEIISIPLEGKLAHKDSMGNGSVIEEGDIQIMSAGTGILHSEFNGSDTEIGKFLQIWIFPKERNIKPRYDQISIRDLRIENKLYQIVSPDVNEQGVQIMQDAWFHMGEFDNGVTETYKIRKEGNGVYIFVIEGNIEINGTVLKDRDALGISDEELLEVKSNTKSKFLIMDIPMSR
jgi:redox-sensitive bicupin YhaK (pirin superfamily)